MSNDHEGFPGKVGDRRQIAPLEMTYLAASLLCAVKGGVFPVGASPTRPTQSLRPEAIGAAAEVTTSSKPSRQMRRMAVQQVDRP